MNLPDYVLPIGTVVVLNGADVPLIIVARAQLFDNDGTMGFFDYAACLYPAGFLPDRPLAFFNGEDIDTVLFEGYRDPQEVAFAAEYPAQVAAAPYPRLSLERK